MADVAIVIHAAAITMTLAWSISYSELSVWYEISCRLYLVANHRSYAQVGGCRPQVHRHAGRHLQRLWSLEMLQADDADLGR
jgi:hypothetical protein